MAGGYWLAGRTLAPIEQLRQEAAAISAHTMGQRRRLGDHLPNDEVGRLARTFDDMLARLDAVFQQQRRFTADASHELRTPLSIIRGEIDVALERPRTPTMYVQVLTSIRAEAERMSRLVADLLWLSRSDNRQLSLQVEPLDLAELLEALVEQLAGAAETAGVHLKLAMSPPIPLCGDMDRLLQLFLNLLDNAITYAPGSTVTVRVHPEPHTVRVEVADTGPGIPAEHLPHLFERFYRVDPARSREQGGSGLGLAIAQEIAQAHGGHIQVSSILHAGTTFTVTLPRMAPGCPQGLLP
ncbi:MAG: hypothetical protein KatS3mg050_2433 [Litorilinea sp.]|nr:MAG: hypothetical protein KatS3mg050_2433 [Litorilinea sp.]